ncbi:Cell shape-determining protein MreC [Verrucomicrobia bacterium]|nr:Cell shape-determining protein MreC [Verrucomicrobiota bacterium]
MLKRAHYIALGLIVVLTLTILNLPGRTSARLKLGLGSVFLPLFGLAGSAHDVAGAAGGLLVSRRELLRQNEALRHENQELRLQAMHDEAVERENARLGQLLGWEQRQARARLKLARVIAREPSNWWRTVLIDLGSRNGLTNNLPVLSADGFLIGRLASVSLTRSQIVLLGDPNCKVGARVDNDTRDTGIIGATGPLDSGFVEMSYLSKNANLKPGQNVKTSGYGGIFPVDIPIGRVVDSQTVEYGLYTVARVKLGANLNALEEVWVMLP